MSKQIDQEYGNPERIIIEQATPYEYVGRLWFPGVDDYEPIRATFYDQ